MLLPPEDDDEGDGEDGEDDDAVREDEPVAPVGELSRQEAVSVVAAFFDSGFLKAGMPFEMASTPVSAVQPAAKVRISSQTSEPPAIVSCAKAPTDWS